jgi:hypothetical protein
MDIRLSPHETRVLGCLIEKELTTPDYYPLSLNALTLACNQRSNREPVMDLGEGEVQAAVDALMRKHLVWERGGAGGRVARYAHRLTGTLTRPDAFSREELAVLAVLMLRGPQTPGELRARTGRMAEFAAIEDLERILEKLATRSDGPYLTDLGREPGRRERRYAHLLEGPVAAVVTPGAGPAPGVAADGEDLPGRLAALEERVAALETALAQLRGGP